MLNIINFIYLSTSFAKQHGPITVHIQKMKLARVNGVLFSVNKKS